jgi:mRNA interferase RelE/StbE
MANFDIRFKESVARDLRQLPNSDIERILKGIHKLQKEPRPTGCEKLSTQERYHVRQGNYRIIYEVDDENQIVIVYKVGHIFERVCSI